MQLHLSEKSSSCLTERKYGAVCALCSDFLTHSPLAALEGKSEARCPCLAQGSCSYSIASVFSALYFLHVRGYSTAAMQRVALVTAQIIIPKAFWHAMMPSQHPDHLGQT